MPEGENTKTQGKTRALPKPKPSLRMIKTAKAMVGKGGKSFAKAAKEAGYSDAVANNPAKVTKTQSWQALMDKYLPQDLIAEKHAELLTAEHTNFFVIKGQIKKKLVPDHMARRAGVEMAHKLRGNFAPEKIELSKRKFQDMSNAELAAYIESAKSKLIKK